MSEKFTPGPWEIIGQFEDKVYHEASDTVIAQAWYPGASSKSQSPADTMKATARLIAAAPDMYEALQDARIGLDLFIIMGELDEGAMAVAKHRLAKLDAAIAKAEGTK